MSDLLIKAISFLSLIIAIMVHEVSHALMAYWCGDPTAKNAGRITLNPIKHVDPIGTIVLPVILTLTGSSVMFGWAKPVPINLARTRNPRQAFWMTALAGPGSNLIQAIVGVVLFKVLEHNAPTGEASLLFIAGINFAYMYSATNIVLMTFNLIPIPPLDGSKVLAVLLPDDLAYRYLKIERFGFIIVFLLLQANFFDKILYPILFGFLKFAGMD